MNSLKIVLLVGTPVSSPGLLFKMFLDVPGAGLFFRPFTPNLDLIAAHYEILVSEPQIPANYFRFYGERDGTLLSRYSIECEHPTFGQLEDFLSDCAHSSESAAVFELGDRTDFLEAFLVKWPDSVVIAFGSTPNIASVGRTLEAEELISDYTGAAARVLQTCGLDARYAPQFLNADWYNLAQSRTREIPAAAPFPRMERKGFEQFLRLKKSILQLSSIEPQISSLIQQRTDYEASVRERIQGLEREVERLAAKPRCGFISRIFR